MGPRENTLRSLLSDIEFQALQTLATSSGLVTGRSIARTLGVSPTTASAALAKLLEAGFSIREQVGKAFLWQVNRLDPTIADWLLESRTDQPVDDRPRMKALILTALPGEYAAVADHLKFDGVTHISEIRFERGTFEGENITWELYAAEIGMGNVTASIVLTAADYQLHPDLVLFVGVAGSVKPKDLCRGDVVVPERVYQLGGGKEVFKEAEGSVLLARPISFEAQVAIVQLARSIARADWMAEQTQVRPDIEARNAQGSAPRAVIRPVAAGERVLADDQSDLVRGLRDHFNDVVAVDMESRGIYEAAKYQRTPALSIRGISDHLGDKAPETDEEWHPIAASHAASFAFALLRRAGTQDIAGRDRPPQEEPPTETGAIPLREALFSLPPNVAVAHSWATRAGTAGRDQLVADLNEQREDPAGWLERLTSRELPLSLRSPESTPLLFMVAMFAEAHEHSSAASFFEKAAERSSHADVAAPLLGRAAWAARRHEATEHSDQLLLRAREAQPEAESLWRFYDLAFENEPSAVLDSSLSIAQALGLRLPQIRGRAAEPDHRLEALSRQWETECPELLDLLRFQVALVLADALRRLGEYPNALEVYESLSDPDVGPQTRQAVWRSLVGPRNSVVPLEMARTICMRVGSNAPEPGLDVDLALAGAVELALTARDRRLDWNGPTSDPLALAAEAKARAGDPRGALRLLLPPPRGCARPAEAAAPQVIDMAPGIAFITGDVELTLELARKVTDPLERRLIGALALARRPDSHPEAATEFRAVLSDPNILSRDDQRIRALLGLTMVAELTPEDEQHLVGLDEETRNLIRAQSMISAGQGTEAQILMRQYDKTVTGLQINVEVLVSQGRMEEAVAALEEYATRHGEERLLLQGAGLAMSAGLLTEAERLAARVSASHDIARRRISLEILIDIAQQRGDWPRVITETRRLLSDAERDNDDPDWEAASLRYRWARVNALFQERDAEGAYTELDSDPPLEATTTSQAMLIIAVLRLIAPLVPEDGSGPLVAGRAITQRDVLRRASTIAKRFPDEEKVVAAALTTSLSMPVHGPIDPEELIEARSLQEQFFNRFPESKIIRRVSVPDSPEELATLVGEQLAVSAGPLDQVRKATFVGRVPLSSYAAAAQRSYAQGLIQNAAGAYVVASVDPEVNATEVLAAKAAFNGEVVVDTSALFHAGRVLGDPREMRKHFKRLVLPAPLRDDVLSARAQLTLRSVGSFGWDPVEQTPLMSFHDETLTDRWAEEANRLAGLIPLCDVLPDAPFDGDPRNRAWSSAIRLAQLRAVPLLADDVALRHVARVENVPAFGTLQLLTALVENSQLPPSALEEAIERLQQVAAADLPLLDRIQEMAAHDEWRPTGYAAFLLTRPVAWTPPSKGLEIYMKLMQIMPNRQIETIADWCAAAAYGMALAVPPPLALASLGSLVAWTTLDWKGPEALPLLLARTRRVAAEFAPGADLLRDVIQRLTTTLRHIVPGELVPKVVLQLLENLEEDVRLKAVEYFLATP